MRPRTLTLLFALALVASLVPLAMAWRLPGDNTGYEPVQPLAYSHRLHAGDMAIPCLYCHSSAERSSFAGIPSPSICMNCHQLVTAGKVAVDEEAAAAELEERPAKRIVAPELAKLYESLALDDRLAPKPDQAPTPIAWVRVHALADFVRFDHSPHVIAGVSCQTCHGPVETMERVRQVESLSMGWCVSCHREVSETGVEGKAVHASTDCTTCHY
jgi:hypothetical protein